MGTNKEKTGSRYQSEKYNRTGSRYDSEAYNRRGSRYAAGDDKGRKLSELLTDKKSNDRKAAEKKAAKQKNAKQKTAAQKSAAQAKTAAQKTVEKEKAAGKKAAEKKAAQAKTAVQQPAEMTGLKMPAFTGRHMAAAAAAAAAVLYIGGAVYYSRHFYTGTTVMGVDCSGMTAAEVREEIETLVDGYRLTVEERNGDQSLIYASQVDLTYVESGTLEAALKEQGSALWLFRRGSGHKAQIPVMTEYSSEELENVLQKLTFLDEDQMIAPVDACLTYSDHKIAIEPEVMGTTLSAKKVERTIADALDQGLSEVSLDEADCYINPTVYEDDPALVEEMTAKNQILGACVTLNFMDRTETVDVEQIESWLTKNADGTYTLGDEPVWNYISELAQKYDTYGGERTFTSTIGTVEYLYGGDYGWQMDQDETAQTLLNAIREQSVCTIDPIYTHTAMDRSENDIGDTYVEICIARQQMWFYKNGELLVDTPVVTGNPSKQNDTPAGGVWALDGKYLNFTLVGADYRTPVNYWMPFNGGVGIHDLQSRAYFGGSIYLTNGSHGCVNTPLTAVATIYDHIDVGTPVIVYTGE